MPLLPAVLWGELARPNPRRPLRDHGTGEEWGRGKPSTSTRPADERLSAGHYAGPPRCCCGPWWPSPCRWAEPQRYRYAAEARAQLATSWPAVSTNWQGMEKSRADASAAMQQTCRGEVELLADVGAA